VRIVERVLEQHGFIVEQSLNGRDIQRPWPNERRVPRVGRIDPGIEIADADFEVVGLAGERGRCAGLGVPPRCHLQFGQTCPPSFTCAAQLLGQGRWHARTRIEVALSDFIEQPARERLLVQHQRAASSI
jgi:hypothetical protein